MSEKRVETGRIGVFEFKVRFTVAALLIILGSLAIATVAYLPAYRELLIFSSTIVGGGAVIYAAYFAALTLRINLKRDMLKSALSIINIVNGHELTKVRTLIEEKLKNGNIAQTEIYKVVTDDKETHDAVRIVLNHLENVSISVQMGDSDEEMVYRGLCWIVPNVFNSLRPYITERRRRVDASLLFIELERLAKCWESGKYLSTGKPLLVLV